MLRLAIGEESDELPAPETSLPDPISVVAHDLQVSHQVFCVGLMSSTPLLRDQLLEVCHPALGHAGPRPLLEHELTVALAPEV